ncbi:MAG: pyruvate dehydrogenase (acetyl-transferring), homodimeric type [Candidatus Hydrogenedentes bacterium]|nr:pyruvate dehydrogenase (acetyl-transferring), homodimeric type [Candidatus Hydrogenedentota bacterium]
MSDDNSSITYDYAEEEWIEAIKSYIEERGADSATHLIHRLQDYAYKLGIRKPCPATTPYVNTIPVSEQPTYPGDRELERICKSYIRWNAMAMVVRANREADGIGGHISTYASAATLYEVGFNHFFRGRSEDYGGDLIYIQGHASPGIYARAYLEGRLTEEDLKNFRRELNKKGGLPSYPHPRLMPHFWQFPTVSMGLGPIMAIYQARFIKYLENRGLKKRNGGHVWAFLGDGEVDEPETLGAIGMASREELDNLIFVINCNLQRLDGPVRGNGKIIQELESIFRGAGWNVIKVIWGSDWDPLFEMDKDGILASALGRIPDGEFQKFSVESGEYIRKKMIEYEPRLAPYLKNISDAQLRQLRRGGHDPVKVYSAYYKAVNTKGAPTVILAKTIKGYGLGESGEGKNITHQQKKLSEDELREFRGRFGIPISDDEIAFAPFCKPSDDHPAIKYMHERRRQLGGYLPKRENLAPPLDPPEEEVFDEFYRGTPRPVSTTMAFVTILRKLLQHPKIGKLIVPIVPDEARTFGMEGLFRQVGIYSSQGQKYEPVDSESVLYYKEAIDGQILEEGITEAGAMCSFISAGTAYSNFGINTIPFYIFYSMFGFQRIGDLIWAAGDIQARGFLIGGTSGRTTLAGEGLQHQDGHSHLFAMAVPCIRAYDPAYAYELAVIIQDGIERMYKKQEPVFYYITVGNENYTMPPIPSKSIKTGIIRGIYLFKSSSNYKNGIKVNLLGSGALLNEALKAQEILEKKYEIPTSVFSVTSYKALREDALKVERENKISCGSKMKIPYITSILNNNAKVTVAVTDYVKLVADSIARWVPQRYISLGTDGFGRSDTREALRDYFEVDHRHIAFSALYELYLENECDVGILKKAMKELDISPSKIYPMDI